MINPHKKGGETKSHRLFYVAFSLLSKPLFQHYLAGNEDVADLHAKRVDAFG